ncbi:MAG: gamma-glutamylcyclotransferase family protein [Cytophagales bacterium]|nr:gamma-glutamylcyclotransferase [Bernardetiaceae bacterium]MDW8205579.1 gamma-glutamylcyclotransferase family protein [Cytophagales bacterium]
MKIFVYGTLRAGGSNHYLLQNARLVAKEVYLSHYKMYNFGPYPFVVPCEDASRTIVGEIYEISPDMLPSLDRLEGTEEGLYERIFDERIEAWLYVRGQNAPHNLPEITSGDWFCRNE